MKNTIEPNGYIGEFRLDEPAIQGQKIAFCFLYTDSAAIADLAMSFEGISPQSDDLRNIGTVILRFKPTYDAETVWLLLYDALTELAKTTAVWGKAIDESFGTEHKV